MLSLRFGNCALRLHGVAAARSSLLQMPHMARSRSFAAAAANSAIIDVRRTRNIGISAHIDSGKTTLTERILFYTGRIDEIHDVKGKDGVGAKMDSMDLEREKGITIQSAATYCQWGENHINIIDTPGHVDFTIEVERALRVLDGAIMVLCSVSGVQSQTLTVDRQMKRYSISRIAFINKCDRMGANPNKVIAGIKNELKLPACALQIPMGLEEKFEGIIDIIDRVAYSFGGHKGMAVDKAPVPEKYVEECEERRRELVEKLADLDDEIGELFLNETEPTPQQIRSAIRRQTVARRFVPVLMGSAYKNKGIQPLLDAVNYYLPSPSEVAYQALDISNNEAKVPITSDASKPLLALAFKLDESKFGQLTYLRIYQGTIKKGMNVFNVKTGKKVKLPRLVRMHSNEMQDIDIASAGDVVACFGVECSSMDTFTDGVLNYAMSSMFVPKPVMSLAIKPKDNAMLPNFSKAISKFTREDPTLQVSVAEKTRETIMSGMGELHLDIYMERLKREYNVEVVSGSPSVSFKETVSNKGEFNYLHKKQSGGSGQFARVIGYVEPLTEEEIDAGVDFKFENKVIGLNIPPEYIPGCEKGAKSACEKGVLAGYQMSGVRVVIVDGQSHSVDSSDLAFQIAMQNGIREGVKNAGPQILQPIMKLEVNVPVDFQGAIIGGINKRNGVIQASDMSDDGSNACIQADVPLKDMFGYSTEIRSSTQGKGEFTMEYKTHEAVARDVQEDLVKKFEKARSEKKEDE